MYLDLDKSNKTPDEEFNEMGRTDDDGTFIEDDV